MGNIGIIAKPVRILHLYHDLMNLYGDWGNTDILSRALVTRGCSAPVDKKSVGDSVDFGAYDFVHIGSGTERSQRACMADLARHKTALIAYIESGGLFLATGNSHELFGHAITDATGQRYETLGLLDFETIQNDTRLTGDSVVRADFLSDKLLGFVNRAGGSQTGEVARPFSVELGPGAGSTAASGAGTGKSAITGSGSGSGSSSGYEGIRYKNLLGTYLTGPVLIRNPPLLRYFADELCSCTTPSSVIAASAPQSPEKTSTTHGIAGQARNDELLFDSLEAAYQKALVELSARIGL